jgi:hypothetical protein
MIKLWWLWILIGIIVVVMVMACDGAGDGSGDEPKWRVPSQHPTPTVVKTPGHISSVLR